MSWLKAEVDMNILAMLVTELVTQPLIFWLKATAYMNMLAMLVTELVAQPLTAWLKPSELTNVPTMLVTACVSQPFTSWWKAATAQGHTRVSTCSAAPGAPHTALHLPPACVTCYANSAISFWDASSPLVTDTASINGSKQPRKRSTHMIGLTWLKNGNPSVGIFEIISR